MQASIAAPAGWQPLPLADTHCHYDFGDFDADRAAEWQAARALGLERMLIPGVAPDQWERAAATAAALPGAHFAAGLHPCWLIDETPEAMAAALAQTLRRHRATALGECGVDAMIDTPMEHQLAYLEVQLALAAELQLPLLLHCRRAHNDLIRALKRHRLPAGGVVHAFAGSLELTRQYQTMGFAVAAGGMITYPRANKTRSAFARADGDWLLLESDAPDMPLCGRQGLRNSPVALPHILLQLAELRGEPAAALAARIAANGRRLFGW